MKAFHFVVAVAGMAAIAAAAQAPFQFADRQASELFAKSRAAVCVSRPFEDIRTLRLTGRTRVPGEGTSTIDGEVEIRVMLPDRFVRVDKTASGVRWSGVVDGKLAGASQDRRPERLREERAWWTRLLLGAYTGSAERRTLTLQSGDGAMPETQTLDVAGDGWTARLVVDSASMVPMRIVYWGAGRGNTVTSFADRRVASGLLLPHRVTTTTENRVLETIMFDEVAVNAPFTDADFSPARSGPADAGHHAR